MQSWTEFVRNQVERHQLSEQEAAVVEDLCAEEEARRLIVRQTMIATADRNYLVARQAYRLSSGPDFWWLALHASEKYLKATLLLNDLGVRAQGHDVRSLFNEVRQTLPFVPYSDPPQFEHVLSSPTTIEDAIGRLYAHGRPANRYNEEGYQMGTPDLFLVDRIVLGIRAGCRSYRQYDPSERAFRLHPVVDWHFDWRLDPMLPLEQAELADSSTPQYQAFANQNVVLDASLPDVLDSLEVYASPFSQVYKALRSNEPPSWSARVASWAIGNMRLDAETVKMLSDPSYQGDPNISRHRDFFFSG